MQTDSLSFYETVGFSMWPFLRAGMRLLIQRTQAEDLKIGDIILYRTDSQVVCHRLVKKLNWAKEHLFYARGDNSLGRAEAVRAECILGKAIGVVKDQQIVELTGRWRNFLNRLIIIFGPFFGLVSRIVKLVLLQGRGSKI